MSLPGANPTIVDPQDYPDGVIRLRRKGESNDFLQIHVDGTIWSGNGTASPTAAAGGTPAVIDTINGDDMSFVSTLASGGNAAAQMFTSGTATAASAISANSGAASAGAQFSANADGTSTASLSVNSAGVVNMSHDGVHAQLSFFGAGPLPQQAVDLTSLAAVSAALVALGLIVSI